MFQESKGKVNKKEKILLAALDLFSVKGYDGVGVDEIAEAVGMKGRTLYYYFKGKDAILDELITFLSDYYDENFAGKGQDMPLPDSLEQFVEISYKRLNFTLHDDLIKKFRKVLAMEQFRNDTLRAFTTLHHVRYVQNLNKKIFEHLVSIGAVGDYDPEMLAMEFSFPVSMMIQWIDREPDKEAEAMSLVRKHMDHFIEVYSKH